jgi:hypothetical protein
VPIQTELKGIREAGTYSMMVVEVSKDPPKNGGRMLTILWKQLDGGLGVRQWLTFQYKNKQTGQLVESPYTPKEFERLKFTLGLPPNAMGEDLVGKKALVTLALDEPKQALDQSGQPKMDPTTGQPVMVQWTKITNIAPLTEVTKSAADNQLGF